MNAVFKDHGYRDMFIGLEDIFHATACPDVWAGDLDAETKALVRRVYVRDFALLCEHFNYCDEAENTCSSQVPQMCPEHVLPSIERKNGKMQKAASALKLFAMTLR